MDTCDLSTGLASIQSWLSCSSNFRDILLIPTGIIGIGLLWWRTKAVNRQADAATKEASIAQSLREDSEIERRAKEIDIAIEQLDKKEIGTRIHAIYKLKKIYEANAYFRPIIMEIMTAFLRERWPYPRKNNEVINDGFFDPFPIDKKAILDVIGSRSSEAIEKDVEKFRYLDLRRLDLSAASTELRNLKMADLAYSNLQDSYWKSMNLEGSYFINSTLDRAKFFDVNLKNAYFDGASCLSADFKNSDVEGASFDGAKLDNANFTGVKKLTVEQLRKAASINDIILPNEISPAELAARH